MVIPVDTGGPTPRPSTGVQVVDSPRPAGATVTTTPTGGVQGPVTLGVQQTAAAREAAARARKRDEATARRGSVTTAAQAAVQAAGSNDAAKTPLEKPTHPLSNRLLHPKVESTFTYGRDAVSLQRGVIVRMSDLVTAGGGDEQLIPMNQRYKFRFLFNPETISVSSAAFGGLRPPDEQLFTGFDARFAGQESVSFGLMVDRTQEAYEEGINTRGTLDDIEALYRVCNGNIGSKAGFLYFTRVNIHWGPTGGSGATRIKSSPLPKMEGYISAINVLHTMFTPRMTPIRSTVEVTFQRLSSTASSPVYRQGASTQ